MTKGISNLLSQNRKKQQSEFTNMIAVLVFFGLFFWGRVLGLLVAFAFVFLKCHQSGCCVGSASKAFWINWHIYTSRLGSWVCTVSIGSGTLKELPGRYFAEIQEIMAAGDSTPQVRTAAEWPLSLPARCVRRTCCSCFDPMVLLAGCGRPWLELCVKPKPEQELSK